jgi:hypothetical protein
VEFTGPWSRIFNHQPLGFQRRFQADFLPYVAAYDAYFRLGATPDEVNRAYEDLRAKLAAAPLELEPELAVYPGDLDLLLGRALYSKGRFQSAAEDVGTLRDAVAGRDRPADLRAQGRRQALADDVRRARELGRSDGPLPVAPDARRSTFLSIVCNDTPWPGDRGSLLADSQRLGETYPLLGWRALARRGAADADGSGRAARPHGPDRAGPRHPDRRGAHCPPALRRVAPAHRDRRG